MTILELINELNKIEDKSQTIHIGFAHEDTQIKTNPPQFSYSTWIQLRYYVYRHGKDLVLQGKFGVEGNIYDIVNLQGTNKLLFEHKKSNNNSSEE